MLASSVAAFSAAAAVVVQDCFAAAAVLPAQQDLLCALAEKAMRPEKAKRNNTFFIELQCEWINVYRIENSKIMLIF
jgi:hypothetical protein